MWNFPHSSVLSQIPKLYQTENVSLQDKIIHLHFFIGSCDWYIAEYDGQDIMWGFAILGGDTMNAEWGYISFNELKEININAIEVDYEIYWQPKKACEIDKIQRCSRF